MLAQTHVLDMSYDSALDGLKELFVTFCIFSSNMSNLLRNSMNDVFWKSTPRQV